MLTMPAIIETTHIVNDILVVGVPLLIALQTWIIKELYSLKSWKASAEADCSKYKTYGDRLDKVEDWRVRSEAVMEPDKELRRELPVIMEIIKQHNSELQTIRESLLLTQKEITTKLEAIAVATKDIQTNCVMHKMLTSGKSDILANFIQKEISKSDET